MKIAIFSFILIVGLTFDGFGQIHSPGMPLSKGLSIDEVPIVMLIADRQTEQIPLEKQPLLAGFTIPFQAADHSKGKWTESEDGWLIWQIGITVPDANGLNVYFSNFNLGEGEKVFLYNEAYSEILGAFNHINNGGQFATEFLPGVSIIIEYNTNKKYKELPFAIREIGFSVLEVSSQQGFGDSGSCEVNVNCPEGENWQTEKRGVARILVKDGTQLFWCAGSLVNNTNLDGTPYFLTAKHCGETSSVSDYSDWVFHFNYEATDCESPVFEPQHQSLTGSQLLARSFTSNNSGSDFKLLLLDDEVPSNYKPYFNGWDHSGVGADLGTGIHHPQGDLKKISTFDDPLVSTNYNNSTPDENGKYWMVLWNETESGHGVTEPGSSGSPIFSEAGYIVGALSGGKASCSSPDLPDYYGKFSYSWASNGSDSARQLQPWLDPANTGVERLSGLSFDSTGSLAFSSDTREIMVGEQVTFYNQSEGNYSGFEWRFSGGTPDHSEMGNPSPVNYGSAGLFDVTLIGKSGAGNDTLKVKDYVTVMPRLSPNPSGGRFRISFGKEMPSQIEVFVTDIQGRNVNFYLQTDESSLTIDLTNHTSGVYLIKVVADGRTEVLKATLVNYKKEN